MLVINGAITSHNYGYSEVSDKPAPLREEVFYGDEQYKRSSKGKNFLRLLPFFIAPFVDTNNEYYTFLMELIQIFQIVMSPVITIDTIQQSKQLIAEHLTKFTKLFSDKNISPKQHYLIHIPTMIKSVGPMVTSSCFSFEAAHKYFKELACKQN